MHAKGTRRGSRSHGNKVGPFLQWTAPDFDGGVIRTDEVVSVAGVPLPLITSSSRLKPLLVHFAVDEERRGFPGPVDGHVDGDGA